MRKNNLRKMSHLPPPLLALTLLYMPLPDLLRYESIDKKVQKVLRDAKFWEKRLAEFGESKAKEPRKRYIHLYEQMLLADEDYFSLGELCASFPDADLSSQDKYAYDVGRHISECDEEEKVDIDIAVHVLLQSGDTDTLSAVLLEATSPEGKEGDSLRTLIRLFEEKYYIHVYTPEMADTLIEANAYTPMQLMQNIITYTGPQNTREVDLCKYLLTQYRQRFSQENLFAIAYELGESPGVLSMAELKRISAHRRELGDFVYTLT